MLKYKCLIIISIFLVTQLHALTWTKTYGGTDTDYGESVQQTCDGGYIITGKTESFGAGGWDVYLIKTDSTGDTLWTKTFGGDDYDWGESVQQTSDDGYIITGSARSFGDVNCDVYLIKTDSTGDTLWTKTYGGNDEEYGYSVQQTSDGGYIIIGGTYSFGAGGRDVYLIKTDSAGDTLWTKTYGGPDGDCGESVQQTSDDGYIIAGSAESVGTTWYDAYLIKTDSVGDTLWTKTYGGADDDYGCSVQQTSDNGYIIAGTTHSYGDEGANFYLIKTDSLGDTLWTRTYGTIDSDYCRSVQQTSDGGYIITGSTDFDAAWNDVYLIKTDSAGDTLWTKTYGGPDADWGEAVQQTSDGGYIITGGTDSFGAGGDVYLIKTDSLGMVGIEEKSNIKYQSALGGAKLEAYPNPFTHKTVISYRLSVISNPPKADLKPITLCIYDLAGRLIRSLPITDYRSPITAVTWNGRDSNNKKLPPGIYFCRINNRNPTATKLILL